MTVLSGLPSVLELDNVFSDLGSLDSVPGGTMERSSGKTNDLKKFMKEIFAINVLLLASEELILFSK